MNLTWTLPTVYSLIWTTYRLLAVQPAFVITITYSLTLESKKCFVTAHCMNNLLSSGNYSSVIIWLRVQEKRRLHTIQSFACFCMESIVKSSKGNQGLSLCSATTNRLHPTEIIKEARNGDGGESSADWRRAESSVSSKLCNEGAFVFACSQRLKILCMHDSYYFRQIHFTKRNCLKCVIKPYSSLYIIFIQY